MADIELHALPKRLNDAATAYELLGERDLPALLREAAAALTPVTLGVDLARGPDITSVAQLVDGKIIDWTEVSVRGDRCSESASRQDPLTKKSQVLQQLQAGGRIVAGDRHGLLQLLDCDGHPVPAWQTALKAAAATARAADPDGLPLDIVGPAPLAEVPHA